MPEKKELNGKLKQMTIFFNCQVMKFIHLIVVMILSLLCACGSSGNRSPGEKQEYFLALNLYNRGDSEGALAYLEKIYRDHPDYLDSTRLYARVLYYSGQEEQALRLWEDLIESGTCYIDAAMHLSRIYLAEERFEEAEDLLKRALSLSPEDPTLLYLLADSRSRRGELREALVLLGRAEVLMERQCEIYLKQASIYQSYGFYRESFQAVTKCEYLLPEDHPLRKAVNTLKNQLKPE